MTRRAAKVEQTRRRITEAAVGLHGTIGPARTTVTAVAERAGVDRLTVYRHFPDERALYEACSRHWRAMHPPPDVSQWAAIEPPGARVTRALDDLYAWYRETHPMLENVIRDRPHVPALEGPAAERLAYVDAVIRVLVRGWTTSRPRKALLAAAVAHATDPTTWRSLTRTGLPDEDAVALMATFVRTVGES